MAVGKGAGLEAGMVQGSGAERECGWGLVWGRRWVAVMELEWGSWWELRMVGVMAAGLVQEWASEMVEPLEVKKGLRWLGL